ncbi:PIN-like domain-containing protein [Bacillus sp. WLY-B-L8]|uniref:PIN-like domain-containing protein n=1 Tax=Bacillus multifaciens TaxID=3068506 RepID=UPI002741C887|nr:PIN-like domain-containing protein [Bacillus sp. WLY-B-L8]MDP7981022.1 PIN-like domain-containing protein [Bacillus sp. WLY-B-L8]
MKTVFPEFYKYTEEEFKNIFSDCYFIIDTNVLLNLYRYSESTKNELIGILEKVKKQLWMPYQVGLEFHFNREAVILEQKLAYDNICNAIGSKTTEFTSQLKKDFNKKHPKIDINRITERMVNCFNELIDDVKKHEDEHPNLLINDTILDSLSELYENKVGEPYPKEKLEEIYENGEERYKRKFPPGFEDEAEKKDAAKEYNGIVYKDKFGDLIVWFQMIDKAKKENKPIIFVTDDVKKDWWKIEKGRTIGPRIELLNEFKKEANVPFYMYKTERFMSHIKEYLKEQVNEEAIKEMEDLRQSDIDDEPRNHQIIKEIMPGFAEKLNGKYEELFSNYINAVENRKFLIAQINELEEKIDVLLEENNDRLKGSKNVKPLLNKVDYILAKSAVDKNKGTYDLLMNYKDKLAVIYEELTGFLMQANG